MLALVRSSFYESKENNLIVEEDRSYRELLKNALSSIYTIIDTGNLREAIHLAQPNNARFDYI